MHDLFRTGHKGVHIENTHKCKSITLEWSHLDTFILHLLGSLLALTGVCLCLAPLFSGMSIWWGAVGLTFTVFSVWFMLLPALKNKSVYKFTDGVFSLKHAPYPALFSPTLELPIEEVHDFAIDRKYNGDGYPIYYLYLNGAQKKYKLLRQDTFSKIQYLIQVLHDWKKQEEVLCSQEAQVDHFFRDEAATPAFPAIPSLPIQSETPPPPAQTMMTVEAFLEDKAFSACLDFIREPQQIKTISPRVIQHLGNVLEYLVKEDWEGAFLAFIEDYSGAGSSALEGSFLIWLGNQMETQEEWVYAAKLYHESAATQDAFTRVRQKLPFSLQEPPALEQACHQKLISYCIQKLSPEDKKHPLWHSLIHFLCQEQRGQEASSILLELLSSQRADYKIYRSFLKIYPLLQASGTKEKEPQPPISAGALQQLFYPEKKNLAQKDFTALTHDNLKAACEQAPENAKLWGVYGDFSCQILEDAEQARQAYQKAVALAPADHEIFQSVHSWLMENGDLLSLVRYIGRSMPLIQRPATRLFYGEKMLELVEARAYQIPHLFQLREEIQALQSYHSHHMDWYKEQVELYQMGGQSQQASDLSLDHLFRVWYEQAFQAGHYDMCAEITFQRMKMSESAFEVEALTHKLLSVHYIYRYMHKPISFPWEEVVEHLQNRLDMSPEPEEQLLLDNALQKVKKFYGDPSPLLNSIDKYFVWGILGIFMLSFAYVMIRSKWFILAIFAGLFGFGFYKLIQQLMKSESF